MGVIVNIIPSMFMLRIVELSCVRDGEDITDTKLLVQEMSRSRRKARSQIIKVSLKVSSVLLDKIGLKFQ